MFRGTTVSVVMSLVVVIAAWALLGLGVVIFSPLRAWLDWLIALVILALLVPVLRRYYRSVGMYQSPSGQLYPLMGVVTQFGAPVKAIRAGLYFLFYPFYRLVLYPTGPYNLTYNFPDVFSKEEGGTQGKPGQSQQALLVKVDVSWFWPRPGVRYLFPMPTVTPTGTPVMPPRAGLPVLPVGYEWEEIDGERLLLEGFPALTFDPLKVSMQELWKILEGPLSGSLRTVVGQRTHRQCTAEKEEIEQGVKLSMVLREGDVVRGLRIPPTCMDVQVSVFLPDDLKKALAAPENEARSGEGRVAAAKADAEAAAFKRQDIEARLAAFIGQGVAHDIAAMIVGAGGQQAGERLSWEQFRDIRIIESLGGGRRGPMGVDDLVALVAALSPQQRTEVVNRVLQRHTP